MILIDAFKRFLNLGRAGGETPVLRRIGYRPRTQAGVLMNADQALCVSAVWGCIGFLTSTVGVLPWQVRRKTGPSSVELKNHPMAWLIGSEPSEEWTSFQFREVMLSWALRKGNGFAEIVRDEVGRARELCPIHPDRVDLVRVRETGKLAYLVDGKTEFEPRDMFHLRGYGESPLGLDVMTFAAESIGQARAVQLFGAAFFGSGANLSGVVEVKEKLSPEAFQEAQERFEFLYKGPQKSHKVAFIDAGMKFQAVTATPEASQAVQTQQFMVEEVCRWFRVPPHKVQHLLKATWANIEHLGIEVVTDSINPWVRRFCDEADKKLFGPNRGNIYTAMDISELTRGDTAARMARYKGMRELGALNADEIRELEGMEPLGRARGGQMYVMQGQYRPLELIMEPPEPTPASVVPAPGGNPAQESQDAPPDRETSARLDRVLIEIGAFREWRSDAGERLNAIEERHGITAADISGLGARVDSAEDGIAAVMERGGLFRAELEQSLQLIKDNTARDLQAVTDAVTMVSQAVTADAERLRSHVQDGAAHITAAGVEAAIQVMRPKRRPRKSGNVG